MLTRLRSYLGSRFCPYRRGCAVRPRCAPSAKGSGQYPSRTRRARRAPAQPRSARVPRSGCAARAQGTGSYPVGPAFYPAGAPRTRRVRRPTLPCRNASHRGGHATRRGQGASRRARRIRQGDGQLPGGYGLLPCGYAAHAQGTAAYPAVPERIPQGRACYPSRPRRIPARTPRPARGRAATRRVRRGSPPGAFRWTGLPAFP